ncbi:MAG: YcaQ family DNA glycosylase [Clostridia bacterium]|nr:YcaQ family DNA glycosylase [Clostridia bacterium]
MERTISLSQARRFILRRQGLLGEYRYAGVDGVIGFVRAAGCVQFDPVDVCGRSPEVTLLSRVRDYRPALLEEALYGRRALVEYFDKNLCILPAEDWPCFARRRHWFTEADHRSREAVDAAAPAVRAYLKEHGPAFSEDLPDMGRADWYWSDTTLARAALEALYFRGELCVHHRDGARRAFDFAENCLPAELLALPDPNPDDEAFYAWQLRRRIGACGLLWNRRSDAHLGIDGFTAARRAAACDRLLRQGAILPVRIEGMKDVFYLLGEDEPLLEECAAAEFSPRTELIAPLDSFLWDRKQVEAIFGFAYRWEIYTPAAKRQYGAYVLPVLQGEGFCGRIECVRDRAKGALIVRNYWPEPGAKTDKRSLRRAVRHLAEMQGLPRIEMR